MGQNFWTGKEVEGRFKDLQTLFIVGDQTIPDILDKIDLITVPISHLYFGAGHQSQVSNYNTIRYFILKDYLITYEVFLKDLDKVPQDIVMHCHIIACIRGDNVRKLKVTDTIKLETSSLIYCTTKEQFMKTSRTEYQDTFI